MFSFKFVNLSLVLLNYDGLDLEDGRRATSNRANRSASPRRTLTNPSSRANDNNAGTSGENTGPSMSQFITLQKSLDEMRLMMNSFQPKNLSNVTNTSVNQDQQANGLNNDESHDNQIPSTSREGVSLNIDDQIINAP